MQFIRSRKSGEEWKISREEFKKRFMNRFKDSYFDKLSGEIAAIEEVAWKAYCEGRKAPNTVKAGPGYKDPEYKLSSEWVETSNRIKEAQMNHDDPNGKPKALLVCASDRNEHTCPGEMSKSYRLTKYATDILKEEGVEVEVLNLSDMTSEYGKVIHPCKGCVSTSMALCHWPCSCYPHHSLGQVDDWMNDIYPMWVKAHGIMIITPVYWHQAPSALKLMIDRLVCADGGNTDPTSTHGKDADKAKEIELEGWDYPRHLQGRVYSLFVHGDTMGVDDLKNTLSSWLNEMMLIPAGAYSQIGRYIGYYGPYATSHEELDKDHAIFEEVKDAALSLALNINAERSKKLKSLIPDLHDPRPK